MNSGDTAFMIIASAMVLLMTPGLAFFYGGMVRRKNVVNTMLSTLIMIGIGSLLWVAIGYSLSFSGDGPFIGDLKQAFLNGVGQEPGAYSDTIPGILFVLFQMSFAVITPAIITGSTAGRMTFKATVLFMVIWSVLVYYPMAHMVWGHGGFLGEVLKSVDFAGGNAVHISSGVSGLVLAIMVGKRYGHKQQSYRIHNIPFVVLGVGILYFGWFAFNAGSSLEASGVTAHVALVSNISAAAGMLSWVLIDVFVEGKPTLVGAVTGLLLGLVAITPGAGYVPVWSSLIIGALVSPICYFMMAVVKKKFGYDDALDAFGCHGVGGIWGGIATGIFASRDVSTFPKWDGLLFGDWHLFVAQVLSVVFSIVFAIIGTLICGCIVKLITPLRVSNKDERIGLDKTQHNEEAYPAFNGLD